MSDISRLILSRIVDKDGATAEDLRTWLKSNHQIKLSSQGVHGELKSLARRHLVYSDGGRPVIWNIHERFTKGAEQAQCSART